LSKPPIGVGARVVIANHGSLVAPSQVAPSQLECFKQSRLTCTAVTSAQAVHSGRGTKRGLCGTQLSLAVGVGLIGYYLVYFIGVRLRVARYE
jgi:hypothetical protein